MLHFSTFFRSLSKSAYSDPDRTQRMRVVEAWRVLMGQRVTPVQIQAEWVEYKMIFEDILQRFSAQLARNAKMEKKRLKRLADDAPTERPEVVGPRDRKAELRSRAAAMRGLAPMRRSVVPNGVANIPVIDPEDIEEAP